MVDEFVKPVLNYELLDWLGTGSWFHTYMGRKFDNSIWAMKFFAPNILAKDQMEKRDLTIDKIMQKACLFGYNKANDFIAQNTIELDVEGNQVLVEEYFDRTLEDFLNKYYIVPTDKRDSRILKLAKGLNILHNGIKKDLGSWDTIPYVHTDIKPLNIADTIDGRVKYFDFATGTIMGKYNIDNKDYRTVLSTLLTRAQEGFKGEFTQSSDTYSLCCILHRMLVGYYPMEKVLEPFDSIEEKMKHYLSLNKNQLKDIVKHNIAENKKIIPKPYQEILINGLSPNPKERYAHGGSFLVAIEDAQQEIFNIKKRKRFYYNLGITAVVSGLFLGVMLVPYFSKSNKMGMPKLTEETINSVSSPLKGQPLRYAISSNYGHNIIDNKDPLKSISAWAGENYDTWVLLTAYRKAHEDIKGYFRLNDNQFRIYSTNNYFRQLGTAGMMTAPEEKAAYIINYALNTLSKKPGKIKLEDVLTIATVDVEAYLGAIARTSNNYSDYIKARDDDGKLLISPEQRAIIEKTLSYIHLDDDILKLNTRPQEEVLK